LYATDAARAYQAALRAPDVDGATIDIVSGFRHQVREVVDELCALIAPPSARPRYGAMSPRPNEQDVPGDPSPAGEHLAWQAEVDIDLGLRHTVDWFRQRR
jgi:nucleoside-diphosphate-sugar epimerase